jgi:hypothetical protein
VKIREKMGKEPRWLTAGRMDDVCMRCSFMRKNSGIFLLFHLSDPTHRPGRTGLVQDYAETSEGRSVICPILEDRGMREVCLEIRTLRWWDLSRYPGEPEETSSAKKAVTLACEAICVVYDGNKENSSSAEYVDRFSWLVERLTPSLQSGSLVSAGIWFFDQLASYLSVCQSVSAVLPSTSMLIFCQRCTVMLWRRWILF